MGVVHPVVREDGGAGDGPRGHGAKGKGWPDQVGWAAREGMVSGADCVDVGWPHSRIYGDFVQLVLGCGQAAVEVWMSVLAFFFLCPGERVCEKTRMLNHCNCSQVSVEDMEGVFSLCSRSLELSSCKS